ncbi:MAG: rhodanese-like domain-containing protein [Bacteroidales bacterium]|nr:rhodanese-like domain-containing protein [Bacteroidales bacterium]
MDELNKTNRLTIAVIGIVLVIIIGLVTLRRPDIKYSLTPAESLALLNDPASVITPEKATALLKDSSGKTVFIDVRNSIAFDRGHIKNAVNIPVRELFAKKSMSAFRDIEKAGQTAVLYGETQQQANGPWFMLRQTGFKNVLLFTGSYTQLDIANSDSTTRFLPQLSETPLINTAALKAISTPVAGGKDIVKPAQKAKKAVAPVKKEASSGGGC